jgi:hypothetical protein
LIQTELIIDFEKQQAKKYRDQMNEKARLERIAEAQLAVMELPVVSENPEIQSSQLNVESSDVTDRLIG